MNSLDTEGFFLTENGFGFYSPYSHHKIGAVLSYGSVLIELAELAEHLNDLHKLMQTFDKHNETVEGYELFHNHFMSFFRDNLSNFAPLMAEDWLDYILYNSLQKYFEKVKGKLTYAQTTLAFIEDLEALSSLSTRLLQILSAKDISQQDVNFFLKTFKQQKMQVRFEKCDITGRADLLFLVEDFNSFVSLEAHAMQTWKCTVKKCRNCGRWFIPGKADTLNCDRISPQYPDKTCKEAAKHIQRLKRENANETAKVYKSIYTMKLNKYNSAKEMGDSMGMELLRKDLYEDFMPAADKWKLEIKEGTKTEEEYLEWLNSHKQRKKGK